MADIPIKFYKSVVRSQKFNPSNPPDLEDPAPVVNPPGSVPTTLYKLLGDVTDSDFIGKNGFVPVVVGENVLTLQSLTTNVLSTPLTGYVVGANTAISASNTILTAFQQVQGQINARVSGSGTTNYLPKFTASGTIGNSQVFDNGTSVGINTITPSALYKLEVNGSAFFNNTIFGVASGTTGIFAKFRTFANNNGGVMLFANELSANRITFGIRPTTEGSHFQIETATGASGFEVYVRRFQIFNTTGNLLLQDGGTFTDSGNKLDVNGTARIRTISNGVGDFLTKSATGVITSRTAAETVTDLSPSFDSRYLRKDTRDGISVAQGSSLGVVYFRNTNLNSIVLDIQNDVGTRVAYWDSNGKIIGTGFSMVGNANTITGGNIGTIGTLQVRATFDGSNVRILNVLNNAGTEKFAVYANGSEGNFSIRSSGSDRIIRRDEKYLNTSENVVTAGAINNQAITDGIFNQRFTLATSITGHANGENGRELTINNANTVSCDLVYESASSTAANRYYFATLANLTIPSRSIVTLIYNSTISRWELKSKNF